jgi:NADH-quinone oxidoreductase subunit N
MTFDVLLQRFLGDTKGSLEQFLPTLAVCATIVFMLLNRISGLDRRVPAYATALGGTVVAFLIALLQFWEWNVNNQAAVPLFTGLLVFDKLTAFLQLFLLLFLVLTITLTVLSSIPDLEDGPDFYTLLLGSVVGMLLMVSANHLLIVFLGIEMLSVPSYAMVGFTKGRRQSSEAALKYVVYGAGASGIMLYGLSLIAGITGTVSLPEIAGHLQAIFSREATTVQEPAIRTLVLALLMVMVGFSFKLSIVPFHFWCPDAFHGATAEVAGFLSVASKAAAFTLLVRFALAVVSPEATALHSVYLTLGLGIGVLGAVSSTFGNLAAYAQSNMKRLLAYSTIAHAGYMLMAVSALIVLRTSPDAIKATASPEAYALYARASVDAVEGLLYYLCVYLFMNLGAFAIVALIRNQIFSEEIDDYKGLGYQSPALAACMAVCLFSLVGLPPLGGFFAKLAIFASVYEAARVSPFMFVLLVIGLVNTVFSLFYYVRVLKTMLLDTRPAGALKLDLPFNSVPGFYVALVAFPVAFLGVNIDWLSRAARSVASTFFP